MRNLIIAILAWISGVIGQTAVAKEFNKNISSDRHSEDGRNAIEIARDKSITNSLSEAGVLKHGDNDIDRGSDCYGGGL